MCVCVRPLTVPVRARGGWERKESSHRPEVSIYAPSLSPQMLRTGLDSASETSPRWLFSQLSLPWYKTFITRLPDSTQDPPSFPMTYTDWCLSCHKTQNLSDPALILPSWFKPPTWHGSKSTRPWLLPTSPAPCPLSPLYCTCTQGSDHSRIRALCLAHHNLQAILQPGIQPLLDKPVPAAMSWLIQQSPLFF